MHDFNGHEVNGIHGLYGKKGYDEALYSVNKRNDITEIHDINGNFPYDDIPSCTTVHHRNQVSAAGGTKIRINELQLCLDLAYSD